MSGAFMGNSVETLPLATTRRANHLFTLPRVQLLALLALLFWLYHSILYRLVVQWGNDPNISYGYFVPAFALYVLWSERAKLKAILPVPGWEGIALVLLGLFLLVFGVLGVELFTQRVSLLVLLAGLVVVFLGWQFLRAVLFPWAFLFLMIPLPNLIMQRITFPLQLLASMLATFMLRTVGIPVNLQGNVIYLSFMTLEVIEACSGIRSLLSLIALAIIYGYLMEKRLWVRVVLACSAVPIAVFANGFRIFGTGVVGRWDPDKAQGFFHEFQGWLVFVVSLLLLFAVHHIINLLWNAPVVGRGDLANSMIQRSSAMSHPDVWSSRFTVVAALMLMVAIGIQLRSQSEVLMPRQTLSSFPAQIAGWKGTDAPPLDQESLDILGHPEYLLRDYADEATQGRIELFIAYYPTQKVGETPHTPAHCLVGAGWIPTSRQIIRIAGPDGASFPVNRFVVSKDGQQELALYWFEAQGRRVASEYRLKYYLVSDAIRMNRSDGALIRIMTQINEGESVDDAQKSAMDFVNRFLPLLNNYIPQ
jgi:exosortase D (VPLPA-CTERM-specific)